MGYFPLGKGGGNGGEVDLSQYTKKKDFNDHVQHVANKDNLGHVKVDETKGIGIDDEGTLFSTVEGGEGKVKTVNTIEPDETGNIDLGPIETPTGAQDKVDFHSSDKENPHEVTKEQVGLGNLLNEKQATDSQLKAHEGIVGNSSDSGHVKLSNHTESTSSVSDGVAATPLAVKTVFDYAKEEGGKIDSHVSDVDNPHKVTKAQVGLGDVDNTKQATKLEFDTHAKQIASANKLGHIKIGKNLEITEDGTLNAIAGGTLTPAGVTNLIAKSNDLGTSVVVTWTNPTNDEFIKTDLYKSTQLLGNNLETIKNQGELIYSGTEETFSIPSVHGQEFYFYAVTYHSMMGKELSGEIEYTSVVAKDIVPPGIITEFTASPGDGTVALAWVNPVDDDFEKVKIMYKIDSPPTDVNDGESAYEGKGTNKELKDLENDKEHYFRAFTFDVNGNINSDNSMQVTATPKEKPKVQFYGVRIDKGNSNPETAVTRTGDAVGLTVENFWNVYPYNAIRAVLVKSGIVQAELSKDLSHNYVASDGDVFMEFSKFWWKFENTPTHLEIKIATAEVEGFVSPAFEEKEKIYIGRYLGYELDGKLRSVKGYEPTGSKTIGDFRVIAQANGTGYSQLPYLATLAVQVLYLVQYANLDSQTALGRGWVDSPAGYANTGGTDGKGFNYGETTGKLQMSLYGIEDFWGNKLQWLDGIATDANNDILVSNGSFNDNGSGYTKHTNTGAVKDDAGYIKDVMGGDITGFLNADKSGSSTTYYCDNGYIRPTKVAYFGGYRSDASSAGAFFLRLYYAASGSGARVGARLYFS